MPNGECSPASNTERTSATPSASASRNSVMRFALGTPAPARFITRPATHPRMLFALPGLAGALVSATSTSPLGSTSIQRGWSKPVAKAATRVPVAACGVAPAGQPVARAMFTVGSNVLLAAGSTGEVPVPCATVSVATSPQPPITSAPAITMTAAGRPAKYVVIQGTAQSCIEVRAAATSQFIQILTQDPAAAPRGRPGGLKPRASPAILQRALARR